MASFPLHLLPLAICLIVYAAAFVYPLGRTRKLFSARRHLDTLIDRLLGEISDARRAAVRRQQVAVAGDGAADGDDELPPTPTLTEDRRQRARRFDRPRVLQQSGDQTHELVAETAAYFRARYPAGDFRQFEIERLPAFARFVERYRAARSGAGLFVLAGLLGTMYKLETVVREIGGLSREGSMEADAFLEQMGLIMDNTGGAFWSSIIGLGAMLVVLFALASFDRFLQAQLDEYDHDVQMRLVPALVDLHEIQNPNLSVSDLLSETGEILGRLNGTVGGLTRGMNDSLASLGDRIERMMREFDSFSTQYAKLADLLDTLKAAGQNMADVTKAINTAAHGLDRAADRLRTPIDDLNQDLKDAIGAQTSVTAEGLGRLRATQAESYHELGDRLADAYRQLTDAQRTLREEIHAMQSGMTDASKGLQDGLEAHLAQNASDHGALVEGLRAQADAFQTAVDNAERELAAVAKALKAADSPTLKGVIDRVGSEVGASASKLSASARQLESAADALQHGSSSTLFGWTQQQIRKLQK